MRKAILCAIAMAAALAIAPSAHASGSRIDDSGSPQSFWEWVVSTFGGDDGDFGAALDPNG